MLSVTGLGCAEAQAPPRSSSWIFRTVSFFIMSLFYFVLNIIKTLYSFFVCWLTERTMTKAEDSQPSSGSSTSSFPTIAADSYPHIHLNRLPDSRRGELFVQPSSYLRPYHPMTSTQSPERAVEREERQGLVSSITLHFSFLS